MANNWFPHDATAFTDARLLKVRAKYGEAGYGRYFAILEWLWQMADACADENDIDALSIFLGKDYEEVSTFVQFCIQIGLFVMDNGSFYSTRLRDERVKYASRSASARESVMMRERKKHRTIIERSSNDVSNDHRTFISTNQPTNQPLASDDAGSIGMKKNNDKPSTERKLGKNLIPLAIFTLARGFRFDNIEQISAHIQRFAKASRSLDAFTPEQILNAFFCAVEESRDGYEVQLETVGKKIAAAKDTPPPPKYQAIYDQILQEFYAQKDQIFTHSSKILCQPVAA